MRTFASDNNSGVHPEVLAALAAVNSGHQIAYGDDDVTRRLESRFRELFGEQTESFLAFGGTGANILGLMSVMRPYHAVICTDCAHIHVDECGGPEKLTGSKLLDVPAPLGKLTPESVDTQYHGIGDYHHVQPRVISITQNTEHGTVYTRDEVRALADYAHARNMILHMDGARLSNAAAALGCSLRAITADCGVDVVTFGGTKNGLMGAEAVLFFGPEAKQRSADFKFLRKQHAQLASKMRFLAAQFEALLAGDDGNAGAPASAQNGNAAPKSPLAAPLWLRNARHANAMAQLLSQEVQKIPELRLAYPTEANGVFVVVPQRLIAPLQQRCFFYMWNEKQSIARWMCSWDTTEEDVHRFIAMVKEILG